MIHEVTAVGTLCLMNAGKITGVVSTKPYLLSSLKTTHESVHRILR